eukprot:gene758-401_t
MFQASFSLAASLLTSRFHSLPLSLFFFLLRRYVFPLSVTTVLWTTVLFFPIFLR